MRLKHAQTSLRAPPEIQARIGHRTRERKAETASPSSRTCSDSDPRADRTGKNENRQSGTPQFFSGGFVSRETMGQKALIFFICARKDKQIPPHRHASAPIARLNLRRKAAGFILRMFQLHDRRPREVVSMFRLVRVDSVQVREESEPFFDTRPRVPTPTPFPTNHSLKPQTSPHPAADLQKLQTPPS